MDNTTYVPLNTLSEQLGLPTAWLKVEAEAGHIPCLRAGRRLMFDPEAVRKALTDRTVKTRQEGDDDD